MNVLFVSSSDISGGAARAAYRLHRGLLVSQVESTMLVLVKETDDETVVQLPKRRTRLIRWLNHSFETLPLRLYPNRHRNLVWSLNWIPFPVTKYLNQTNDILHFHWIAGGFIPLHTLGQVRKPVVWTLHDEWAFTGGCHYAYDCTGFSRQCGRCPQLNSHRDMDVSRLVWKQKHRHWKNTDMTVVCPSRWLADRARQSSLFVGRRIEVIPNGINVDQYKHVDRSLARHLLRLPQGKRLILFGALASTRDERKGFHLLQPAIQRLALQWKDNAELVVLGASQPQSPPEFGLPTHYLGRLADDVSLTLLYSAADVFVAPSLSENLPNMIMEAMACGTPSVAFRVGGIPDLIEHQRNGYLAKPYEVEDLAAGIAWVLEDNERYTDLSLHARTKVEQEFELGLVARRYRDLYEEILEQHVEP